ncbi:MAG: 2-C-methyl-D-erythritol 2,4-cyclodiphosphate synthase [Planctomycetota bacterium]|nr:2-C-methyl-D-erythritol 2,4-cyclodiphosphate synthase [Planctomycetota bacterium]
MHKIALGYDSHRFAPGRALILGGVQVTCEQGLAGHSDADAVLHAVTDAILGAIAAGDIGELFDDTDPKWADADSAVFVRHATALAAERGYAIGNCDVTVLAERPKLAPYKAAMRDRIAELLGIEPEAVSVKAKTNEGMGFIGRGEGVAALAAVLLIVN